MGDGVDRRSTKLIIGASTEDTAAGATGCAYVYEDDDEDHSWDFLKQLTAPEGADWDYFGHSVDVSGNSLIAGSYGDDDHGSSSGSAYLYVSIYAGRTVQSWDLDAVGNLPSPRHRRCIAGAAERLRAGRLDDHDRQW